MMFGVNGMGRCGGCLRAGRFLSSEVGWKTLG